VVHHSHEVAPVSHLSIAQMMEDSLLVSLIEVLLSIKMFESVEALLNALTSVDGVEDIIGVVQLSDSLSDSRGHRCCEDYSDEQTHNA